MMRQTLSALALAAAFGVSAMMPAAAAAAQPDQHEQRVYDRAHRDYHAWNGDEDRAYRAYLAEHHRAYRDFQKTSRKQQLTYWNWRHQHEHRDQR